MSRAFMKVYSLAIVLAMIGLACCSPPTTSEESAAEEFSCGEKDTCAEMASCAEARFHLERCGVTTMDGDMDGIPCEVEHCRR